MKHAFGGIFSASFCSSSLQYLGITASSRRGETNFAGDSAKPNTAPYALAAPFSQNSFEKNFGKEIRYRQRCEAIKSGKMGGQTR